MSKELYMAYQAASRFVAMDEDLAGRVIETISSPKGISALESEVIATLPEGTEVVIGRIKGLDMEVCAAVDRMQRAVTVVGFDADVDSRAALAVQARLLMRQSLAVRPVVQIFAEDTAAAIQEGIRAMLAQFQTILASSRFAVQMTKAVASASDQHSATRLFGHAKRWNTTAARAQFRDVLELARTEPQVVEREGRELLIIDREFLERFDAPLSGAELVDRLSRTPLPPLVFRPDVKREAPPALQPFGRS